MPCRAASSMLRGSSPSVSVAAAGVLVSLDLAPHPEFRIGDSSASAFEPSICDECVIRAAPPAGATNSRWSGASVAVAAASPAAAPDEAIRSVLPKSSSPLLWELATELFSVLPPSLCDDGAARVVPISPEFAQNLLAPSAPCSTAVAVLGLSPAPLPALSPVASTLAPERLVSLPCCPSEGLVSPNCCPPPFPCSGSTTRLGSASY
mmetsp:Transcript_8922/g.26565  ORF Transcript_8922/g.26565 Transcript_8922/m.26565 type:complete len:207 (-) Transcript_8922:336-956(-)